MKFNVEKARQAGYTDEQIQEYLAKSQSGKIDQPKSQGELTSSDVGYDPKSPMGWTYDALGKILNTAPMRLGGQFMQGYTSTYGVPADEALPEIGATRGPIEKGARTAGAITGTVNPEDLVAKLFGKAFSPLYKGGGKIISKLPFGTPKAINEALEKMSVKVGGKIGKVLEKSGAKVYTKGVLDDLYSLRSKYLKGGDPKKVKKVGGVIERVLALGDQPSAEIAQATSSDIAQDVFGERGKEVLKRGVGVAEKQAKEVAGGGLKQGVKEAVPEVVPLLDEYKSIKALENEMMRPLKNWWLGGLVGTMTAPFAGLRAIPAGALTSLLAMPYTRTLMKKGVQTGTKAISPLVKLMGLSSSKSK